MIYKVHIIYDYMGVGDRGRVRSATQGDVRHAQRSTTILGLLHGTEVVNQGITIIDRRKHHASRYFSRSLECKDHIRNNMNTERFLHFHSEQYLGPKGVAY